MLASIHAMVFLLNKVSSFFAMLVREIMGFKLNRCTWEAFGTRMEKAKIHDSPLSGRLICFSMLIY